jgi:hypothetical protein
MVAESSVSLAETYEAYKVIDAASLQLLERVFREFSLGQPRAIRPETCLLTGVHLS